MKIEEISHKNPATPSEKPSFHSEPFVIYILQQWYQIQHGPLFFNLLLFLAFVVYSHDFLLDDSNKYPCKSCIFNIKRLCQYVVEKKMTPREQAKYILILSVHYFLAF